MLAEYRTLLPMTMFCTMAVRTGTGDFAEIVASLHAASIKAATDVATAISRKILRLIFTLPRELSQSSPLRSRRPTGSVGIHDPHWRRLPVAPGGRAGVRRICRTGRSPRAISRQLHL